MKMFISTKRVHALETLIIYCTSTIHDALSEQDENVQLCNIPIGEKSQ